MTHWERAGGSRSEQESSVHALSDGAENAFPMPRILHSMWTRHGAPALRSQAAQLNQQGSVQATGHDTYQQEAAPAAQTGS